MNTQLLKSPLSKGLFAIAALVLIQVIEKPQNTVVQAPALSIVETQFGQVQRLQPTLQVQAPTAQQYTQESLQPATQPSARESQQIWNELPKQESWVF
jgi:hypothetical protein